MNKQEFRKKNKKHYYHRAKENIVNYTSQPCAYENASESPYKAPEVRTTDRLALIFGIGISALTMAMIYLSSAK